MKPIIFILGILFLVLQYEFWFSKGGAVSAWRLKQNIAVQQQNNKKVQKSNLALVADIKDLKSGNQSIEERARNELGMVKKGETFYQVVGK